MSSTGSSPFEFSRATATPQSEGTPTRESHETRSTGNVDTTTASSPPSMVPPFRLTPPLRPCRAHKMYTASPCPHAIQLLEMATNALRQRQILRQRAVLRPRGQDKLSRGTVSCVTASARKSYKNLIATREDDLASRSGQPSLDGSPQAREREDSVGLLSAPSSQQSLGNRYLVHATAVRQPSHESAALSDLALVQKIQARVQVQAAGVYDTIPCLSL
jgi:hypothetical protein